jgi:hypothetical protein
MAGVITAVIVDDQVAVAAGVRPWCERAAPPINLIDAQGRRRLDRAGRIR